MSPAYKSGKRGKKLARARKKNVLLRNRDISPRGGRQEERWEKGTACEGNLRPWQGGGELLEYRKKTPLGKRQPKTLWKKKKYLLPGGKDSIHGENAHDQAKSHYVPTPKKREHPEEKPSP